ncbi:MAG: DUF6285 domain-containing protein [Alphaproteobacteria bacterium]
MRPDRPTADELLEAVEEFLRERAIPELEGQSSFHARVAANVIGTVRREVAGSPDVEADQHARLLALLKHDGDVEALNRELCEQIRAGDWDLSDSALLDHLRQVAIENLGVDNPRYSAYKRLTGQG